MTVKGLATVSAPTTESAPETESVPETTGAPIAAESPAPPRHPGLRRRARHLLVIGLLLCSAVVARGWVAGWRVHTMTTPSMGTTAPVGAVVISAPTLPDRLRIGDVVVFHPPGRPGTTFVHRIIGISATPEGRRFRTRGDLNGTPDAWVLSAQDLIGRAALTVPDVGYFLELLPGLLLGAFLIILITRGARKSARAPIRVLAGSLLCCVLLVYYQPLTRIDLIAQTVSSNGGRAAVVPTGVLPLRVQSVGSHTDVSPGQVGTLEVKHVEPGGAFSIHARAHLSGWWWLLALTWAIPLIIAVRATADRAEPDPARTPAPA